ncbi:MAG: GTP pyrophosphokinase [Xenococcaceae cyanobacterium]
MKVFEMNQEALLNQAIELARKAHEEQVDKAGKPYIGHPIRVMNNLATVEEKIVGILHDVIEDSDITLENLTALGFPQVLVEAIDAITKRSGENYEAYLSRVMSNPIALRVKIADMRDNMDKSRIAEPTEKDCERLKKYQATLPRLLEALAQYCNTESASKTPFITT